LDEIETVFSDTPIFYMPNTSGLIAIPKELSASGKSIILAIKDIDLNISSNRIRWPDSFRK